MRYFSCSYGTGCPSLSSLIQHIRLRPAILPQQWIPRGNDLQHVAPLRLQPVPLRRHAEVVRRLRPSKARVHGAGAVASVAVVFHPGKQAPPPPPPPPPLPPHPPPMYSFS